ncbi:MAG: hypothetical protein ABIH00_01040 [Armatimonadota bacterium]
MTIINPNGDLTPKTGNIVPQVAQVVSQQAQKVTTEQTQQKTPVTDTTDKVSLKTADQHFIDYMKNAYNIKTPVNSLDELGAWVEASGSPSAKNFMTKFLDAQSKGVENSFIEGLYAGTGNNPATAAAAPAATAPTGAPAQPTSPPLSTDPEAQGKAEDVADKVTKALEKGETPKKEDIDKVAKAAEKAYESKRNETCESMLTSYETFAKTKINDDYGLLCHSANIETLTEEGARGSIQKAQVAEAKKVLDKYGKQTDIDTETKAGAAKYTKEAAEFIQNKENNAEKLGPKLTPEKGKESNMVEIQSKINFSGAVKTQLTIPLSKAEANVANSKQRLIIAKRDGDDDVAAAEEQLKNAEAELKRLQEMQKAAEAKEKELTDGLANANEAKAKELAAITGNGKEAAVTNTTVKAEITKKNGATAKIETRKTEIRAKVEKDDFSITFTEDEVGTDGALKLKPFVDELSIAHSDYKKDLPEKLAEQKEAAKKIEEEKNPEKKKEMKEKAKTDWAGIAELVKSLATVGVAVAALAKPTDGAYGNYGMGNMLPMGMASGGINFPAPPPVPPLPGQVTAMGGGLGDQMAALNQGIMGNANYSLGMAAGMSGMNLNPGINPLAFSTGTANQKLSGFKGQVYGA